MEYDLYKTDPKLLARMMDLDEEPEQVWSEEELGPILRHQLSASVKFDLETLEEEASSKLESLLVGGGAGIRSFNDLFHHPHPPIELLVMTKNFTKACRSNPQGPLPKEIAMVLYLASIVIAMIRCHQRITELSEHELENSLVWAIDQSWIDEDLKSIFKEGLNSAEFSEGHSQ
jgi:hypothetical protein